LNEHDEIMRVLKQRMDDCMREMQRFIDEHQGQVKDISELDRILELESPK